MKRVVVIGAALLFVTSFVWTAVALPSDEDIYATTAPRFNRALERVEASDLGAALADLEYVLYYAPSDDEARTLRRSIRDRLDERLREEHDSVTHSHGTALESFGAIAAPHTWEAIWFLSIVLLLCLGAGCVWIPPSNARTGAISLCVVLALLSSLAAAGWLGKHHRLSPGTPALVIGTGSELLQNPDPRAKKVAQVIEGERVWRGEQYAGFARVERADGAQGWIQLQAVQGLADKD